MALDEIHSQVIKELVHKVTKSLSMMFYKLWQSCEVNAVCKRGNIAPFCIKGKREDLRNCRPVSLTSVLGKVMNQILLEIMLRLIANKEFTCDGQHGFPM